MNQPLQEEIEKLADKFHDVYQKEIRRQGRLSKHNDKYIDLPEHIKNLDRVLAKYVLTIITKIRIKDLEEVKKELLNWDWRHAGDIEIKNYLDSKIEELK